VPPAIMGNINFVGAHMAEIVGSMNGVVQRRPIP
jgi:hypothetical protein